MWLPVRYTLLAIFLFLVLKAEAQLAAPGSNAVRYTIFTSNPEIKDAVFIYCNTSGTQKGTLTASLPSGTAASNFSWFAWDNEAKSFSIPVKNESGVTASSATNLNEGGYRVVITGGIDTSFTGWIFLDKPFASASLKNRTCEYVALNGEAAIDTFYYSNPVNGTSVRLPNRIKFMWSSNPSSIIPFPDLEIDPQTFIPPLVDVTYMIQVTDSFGCRSEASFPYESIHVKADFSVDPSKGEAPLEVSFTDKSIRETYKSIWNFGYKSKDGKRDTIWEISKDSLWILKDPFTHIYYKPGEYKVKLTIESDKHCIDSLVFDKIVVEKSELDIPNVFTPNDDGLNDRFMVQKKSLKFISVEVFSRSGKMVYNFSGEGEALRNWEGWDGRVNNSSAVASPGVYFYIIRALGWDDVEYDSKKQRGFVYLYR
jgi:gliding motility-associated-like protein